MSSSSSCEAQNLLIEPFYGGSHKQLIDLIQKEIPECHLVTMTAKKWHWRSRVSALYLAQNIPFCTKYKVLFCSSVLNLAELVALRPDLASLKKIIYFHENQLVYPVREKKDRDIQHGYNQILSCLVADMVVFNSQYNMDSFLSSIGKFLHVIPDYRPKNIADQIKPKCRVIYFPLSDQVSLVTQRLSANQTLDSETSSNQVASSESLSSSQTIDTETSLSNQIESSGRLSSNQTVDTETSLSNQIESSERLSSNQTSDLETSLSNQIESSERLSSNQTEDSETTFTYGCMDCESKSSHKQSYYQNQSNQNSSSQSNKHIRLSCEQMQVVQEDCRQENTSVLHSDQKTRPLHIVWAHRWEHDKGPELFFEVVIRLHREGCQFYLSVLGEQFTDYLEVFENSRATLQDHILHWGYLPSKAKFLKVLESADVAVSTALHEFFGVSMLEAVNCGCYPLCPNRLVYPEIYPKQYLYNTSNQLFKTLRRFCRHPEVPRQHAVQIDVSKFSWEKRRSDFKTLFGF